MVCHTFVKNQLVAFVHRRASATAAMVLFGLSACAPGQIIGRQDAEDISGDVEEPADEMACEPPAEDGVCDASMTCGPDIDCMLVFDSQLAAEDYFAKTEARTANSEDRPPRAILDVDDYSEYEESLLEGWMAYQSVKPVGLLSSHRPYLVVVDDPSANAFVITRDAEAGKAAFVVILHSGIANAGWSSDATLALMLHELEHALGLHGEPSVKERLRRHYLAVGGEPLGFRQQDDVLVGRAIARWQELADEISHFRNEALAGWPLNIGESDFLRAFKDLLSLADPNAECLESLERYDDVNSMLRSTYSELRQDLDWSAINTDVLLALTTGPESIISSIRDDCFATHSADLVATFASIYGVTEAEFAATMTATDLEIVQGLHVVDALAALIADRREQMRAIESEFAAAFGVDWSSARYFSYEEAADDVTVPIMREAGRAANAFVDTAVALLPTEEERAECRDAYLSQNRVPPYGENLTDPHHASCWRAWHTETMATMESTTALRLDQTDAGALDGLKAVLSWEYRRLPIPKPAVDEIAY